jgi:hypothetical protein
VRIFLGSLIAAVALAGAAYMVIADLGTEMACPPGAGRPTGFKCAIEVEREVRADWQIPVAIFLAIAGVGAGVAVALPGFRNS